MLIYKSSIEVIIIQILNNENLEENSPIRSLCPTTGKLKV